MNSDFTINLMLIICFSILILVLFSNFFKILFRFIFNSLLGYFLFTIMNLLGFNLGGNLWTSLFCGFLGIPGILVILVINFII